MAMETIIVLNPGSASHKFALYRGSSCLLSVHYERTEHGFARTIHGALPEAITEDVFLHARQDMMNYLEERGFSCDIYVVRVVAPGTYFTEHHFVDDYFIEKLSQVAQYDPAHTEPTLALVRTLQTESPQIPIVAVSDSAFHTSLPEYARRIPLPESLVAEYDMARFGYHGIALSALAEDPELPSRAVVCHLGSGSSVTGLKDGKSIETSMGYSPLEGVPMSSRSGSVDPAVIARLSHHMTPEELIALMYQKSGFQALCGTDDMRVMLQAEATNSSAALAIDMFVRRVAQYVGAYAMMLGGIDAIVFSGTIGERSAPIRSKVCALLAPLGVVLDATKNEKAQPPTEVAHTDSRVRILVRHADETRAAARIAAHTAQRLD